MRFEIDDTVRLRDGSIGKVTKIGNYFSTVEPVHILLLSGKTRLVGANGKAIIDSVVIAKDHSSDVVYQLRKGYDAI